MHFYTKNMGIIAEVLFGYLNSIVGGGRRVVTRFPRSPLDTRLSLHNNYYNNIY